jgi:hypothetical protein
VFVSAAGAVCVAVDVYECVGAADDRGPVGAPRGPVGMESGVDRGPVGTRGPDRAWVLPLEVSWASRFRMVP